MDGWTVFKVTFFCTIKAELGQGQPGLMRWSWDETLPQCSIDRSTFHTAAHRATSELAAAPMADTRTKRKTQRQEKYCNYLMSALVYCSGCPLPHYVIHWPDEMWRTTQQWLFLFTVTHHAHNFFLYSQTGSSLINTMVASPLHLKLASQDAIPLKLDKRYTG